MSEFLPLLPLRDLVVFPNVSVPLFVGRDRSLKAVEQALTTPERLILLSAQQASLVADPGPGDIQTFGTLGRIVEHARQQDDVAKVVVEGISRVTLSEITADPYFQAKYSVVQETVGDEQQLEALRRAVVSAFETYAKLDKRITADYLVYVGSQTSPRVTADLVAGSLPGLRLQVRQGLIENTDVQNRLERLLELVGGEIGIVQMERRIRSRVKKQMERTQKEYYLNEQMQAIQKELGERDEFKTEIQELEDKLKAKKLSEEAQDKTKKELRKLRMMQPMSAEATVVRNYLDWILSLPWDEQSAENYDIKRAEDVLNEDHFGLTKIKDRILEYLAVQALVRKLKGPILCFVGPPGVGKTSLAKSIARATGRNFVRLSLGGVRDESEIRGHRRTYIGALPGRLVQSMRKAGTNNPVILLDEIDKMSSDFRGDPAAALLEVLDPEQNKSFNDHYLDLDYDLSDVMFITTANSLSAIPVPLRDRMEIIELTGYTEYEKLNIATKYLVPRQKDNAGLADVDLQISTGALRSLVHHYTKESGVRSLEREIGSLCRKVARAVVADPLLKSFRISSKEVSRYLGPIKYRESALSDRDEIGLTQGLAVTNFGGSLLECEVSVVPGKGTLVITGLLEKGMQESAQAALSYVRSRQKILGLPADFHSTMDIHVHFPEFVPKDGPSAGITMATSMVSALMRVPVRRTVAMTGEITLRGRVMEIGGLKEKILAAHRAGIKTVLIPSHNRRDLREIPKRVIESLRIVLIDHMDQVLSEALVLNDGTAVLSDCPPPVEIRFGEILRRPVPLDTRATDGTRVTQ